MPEPRTPLLATDCVVLDARDRLLLIRRGNEPFKGALALPGGFVDIGETVEAACRRELREETGLQAGALHLVGVYSDPQRDPRGHVCSVAFFTRVGEPTATAADDAATCEWVETNDQPTLAFDHNLIVRDALTKARTTCGQRQKAHRE